jgi:hypothetical protein
VLFSIEGQNWLETGGDKGEMTKPSLSEVNLNAEGCGSLMISILPAYEEVVIK